MHGKVIVAFKRQVCETRVCCVLRPSPRTNRSSDSGQVWVWRHLMLAGLYDAVESSPLLMRISDQCDFKWRSLSRNYSRLSDKISLPGRHRSRVEGGELPPEWLREVASQPSIYTWRTAIWKQRFSPGRLSKFQAISPYGEDESSSSLTWLVAVNVESHVTPYKCCIRDIMPCSEGYLPMSSFLSKTPVPSPCPTVHSPLYHVIWLVCRTFPHTLLHQSAFRPHRQKLSSNI